MKVEFVINVTSDFVGLRKRKIIKVSIDESENFADGYMYRWLLLMF